MNGKSKKDNPLVAAGLVGALGVNVAICIFLGYLLGAQAEKHFGGYGWLVGGLLVGLAVGILSAIMIVKRVLGDSDG